MFVIFALKDVSTKAKFSASGAWFPLRLSLLVFTIGACFWWQTGHAINSAGDFRPRLMNHAPIMAMMFGLPGYTNPGFRWWRHFAGVGWVR